MTDFRKSAAIMAARLKLFKRLNEQLKAEGRTSLDLSTFAMWEAEDQAALDTYEAELAEAAGAVPLFAVPMFAMRQ